MLKRVFISAVQASPSLWFLSPAEHICPASHQLGISECLLSPLWCQWLLQLCDCRDWHNWAPKCHRHPDCLWGVLVNPCLPCALRFLQEYWLVLFTLTDILWSIVPVPECIQNRNLTVIKNHNTIKYWDFCPVYPKLWWGWTGCCYIVP